MSGLIYTATRSNFSSGTALTDLLVLGTSSAVPILVHEIRVTSANLTDVRQPLRLIRRTTGPTGGTTVIPEPINLRNTVAAATTVTTLPTSVGTAGDLLESELWSILMPYSRLISVKPYIVPVSSWLALELAAAPGSAFNVSFVVKFEEL